MVINKLFILVFLFLISLESISAQCVGKYVLCSQEDVNMFHSRYGPCKNVKTIVLADTCGMPINSLKPLLGIKRIEKIVFRNMINLSNLDGLDSLLFVGTFAYEALDIKTDAISNIDTIEDLHHDFNSKENSDLSMYKNVSWIKSITLKNSGYFSGLHSLKVNSISVINIINNSKLEQGFADLIPIGQSELYLLSIDECNDSKISFEGLDRIKMIHIFDIARINNLKPVGIQKLPKIHKVLLTNLDFNPNLYSLFSDIDTLVHFQMLIVRGVTSLDQVFPNLKVLEGGFDIRYNIDLGDIGMLEHFPLPHNDEYDYKIVAISNPNLNCNIDLFCRAVEIYPDSVFIEGNGGDCTYESISEYCKGYVPLTNIFDTICNGDYYKFGDFVFDKAGDYLDTLQDVQGEDSIVLALNLVVNPKDSIYIDTLICQGNTINIGEEEISEQGIYEFELQNQYGCDSLLVVDVTMAETEIDTVEIIPDYGCDNGAISLTIEGNNPPYAFNWSNGEDGGSVTGLSSGEYKVTITDKSNCEYEKDNFIVSDSVAFMIPNMFFPGGAKDDINSTFKVYLGRDTKILSTEIYSRWGVKVFYTEDNTPWDGTYKGVQSPPGVYLYKVVIDSPCGTKTETGQVMLLR